MATTRRDEFTAAEIKAGVLVLTSLLILAGFVAAIRGCAVSNEGMKVFYATFSDVGGLNSGADVRFGGVLVGEVEEVVIDPDDPTLIRVKALVPEGVPVNGGSVASIEQISLTAEMHLEISTGESGQPVLESGAVLDSAGVASGLFDVPDVEGVITRLETLLDDTTTLLGVDTAASVAHGGGSEVVGLAQVAGALETTLRETTTTVRGLRSLIEDDPASARQVLARLVELEDAATRLMEQMEGVVAENREPIRQTTAGMADLTSEASDSVRELTATLESSLRHLEETGANVSDVFDDERPAIEEILRNLQEVTRNLRELSRTLADDPSALILGGKPRGRKSEGAR